MHPFLNILIASSILAHALLGCCAHHACDARIPAEQSATHRCDGHSHGHAHDLGRLAAHAHHGPHSHQGPHEPHPCCDHRDCQWTADSGRDVDCCGAPLLDSLQLINWTEPAAVASWPSVAGADLVDAGAAPPVRAHLRHCVLLI